MAGRNRGHLHTVGLEHEPAWATKDGRIIAISEMSDGHLLNTVRMLWRWLEDYIAPTVVPDDEFFDGGPYYPIVRDYDPTRINMGPEGLLNVPVYLRLLEEVIRRGLRIMGPQERERIMS